MFSKLKTSLAVGTASAVMISSFVPFKMTGCLFFPSFIISACSSRSEDAEDNVEYSFAIFDLLRSIFG